MDRVDPVRAPTCLAMPIWIHLHMCSFAIKSVDMLLQLLGFQRHSQGSCDPPDLCQHPFACSGANVVGVRPRGATAEMGKVLGLWPIPGWTATGHAGIHKRGSLAGGGGTKSSYNSGSGATTRRSEATSCLSQATRSLSQATHLFDGAKIRREVGSLAIRS